MKRFKIYFKGSVETIFRNNISCYAFLPGLKFLVFKLDNYDIKKRKLSEEGQGEFKNEETQDVERVILLLP